MTTVVIKNKRSQALFKVVGVTRVTKLVQAVEGTLTEAADLSANVILEDCQTGVIKVATDLRAIIEVCE